MYAVTYRKSPLPKTNGNMGVKALTVASSSLLASREILIWVSKERKITFLTLRKRVVSSGYWY